MRRNRMHTIARQSVAFALAGALAASAAFVPATAFAVTSSELQAQLEAAQADLNELQATLDQAEAELGKTNYELDQTRTQIADLEESISKNEEELAVARENLSAIIEQSYKQGGEPGLLELMLSSNSFDDLISRLHYANSVSKAKQEAIQTVSDLQEALEKDKVNLQKNEYELEQLLENQKSQQAAAEEAASKQSKYVAELSDELVVAMEVERQAAAEASRKAAEEAAAKEAEEQAAREKAEKEKQQQQNQNQQEETEDEEESEQNTNTNTNTNTNPNTNTNTKNNSSGNTTPVVQPSQGSGASSSMRQAAVSAALSQVGVAYGHDNIVGVNWDCSGLTSWAWGQAGVSLTPCSGTYSYGQFQIVKSSGRWTTSVGSLQAGDLVFFSNDGGNTCYHVAMYLGGGSIVHAIDYSHGVQVTDLNFCYGFCGGGSPV